MDFEMFVEKVKEKGYTLECSYGCSSYGYVCNGNPYQNPCPSLVLLDEKGNEVDIDEFMKEC